MNVAKTFGNIDVYLFDQILKNRFLPHHTILDAGCGSGRNLHYFMKAGNAVFGIDQNQEAIDAIRSKAKELAPHLPLDNFQVGRIEQMDFSDLKFDIIICNAVLHFANNVNHFEQMLQNMWKHLKSGGWFFARLASDIGIEDKVVGIGNQRYILPDRSERFLVNEKMLLDLTHTLDGVLFEPIKTTNVQGLRCMTTWCVRKK